MGNCASNPKTNEGDAPLPEPAREDVVMSKIEPEEKKEEENDEAKNVEETSNISDEKSLGTLLNENVEDAQKPKTEDVVAQKKEEQPKTEEPKEENAEKANDSEKPQETTQN